jgi:sulfonate transport system permease protein
MVQDGILASYLTITTWRVCCRLAMGALLDVLIGCVVGLSRWAAWLFDPMIQGIRAVPFVRFDTSVILWMGIGEVSKITFIPLGMFFPVYINTCAGVRDCDHKLSRINVRSPAVFGHQTRP